MKDEEKENSTDVQNLLTKDNHRLHEFNRVKPDWTYGKQQVSGFV